MFNWATLPTFTAMLLFWLLAAYLLTRSPRSAISLTAVGAQVAIACYLLGVGMAANAPTQEQAIPWLRNLHWGATLAPVSWYWLTLLLAMQVAQETQESAVRDWRRAQNGGAAEVSESNRGADERPQLLQRFGVGLGSLLLLASAGLTAAGYVDDWLLGWSQITPLPPGQRAYLPFHLPAGPLYPAFVGLIGISTLGAVSNIVWSWRHTQDADRRHRFGWLLVSGLLIMLGANYLGLGNWLAGDVVPHWVGHLLLMVAMAIMGWNVAAYSLLFKGQVIRTDFWYFLTSLILVSLAYALVFVLVQVEFTFWNLGLFLLILILAILSHAFVDLGRQALDRLFFGHEVQQLRTNLATVAQNAGLTPDLDTVLQEAQAEIEEVSAEHVVRLIEQALRRLNNPSALGQCALGDRLALSLRASLERNPGSADQARSRGRAAAITPLERARGLRELLTAAIERLKPPDGNVSMENPAALQYHILAEEYLQGLLNKQIMARHAISEGTFHRNRRQAIWTLAQELKTREEHLAQQPVARA
jgi:hypothetical protein